MRRWMATLAAALAMVLAVPGLAAAGEHRIGFGYHYWKTVDDLQDLDNIEDDGYAGVVSYQYLPGGMLRLELDVEYFKDGFAGSNDTAYSPQAFLLFGRFFYAGIGIGMTYSDNLPSGDDWSGPWYGARAGLDMLLVPKLHLDLNANYRADAFKDVELLNDVDAVTFGASLRLTIH